MGMGSVLRAEVWRGIHGKDEPKNVKSFITAIADGDGGIAYASYRNVSKGQLFGLRNNGDFPATVAAYLAGYQCGVNIIFNYVCIKVRVRINDIRVKIRVRVCINGIRITSISMMSTSSVVSGS